MRSQNSAYPTKWWQDLPLIGLWLVFTIALCAMIVVSSLRTLTQLETLLFQAVTLGTGLLGSYRFGRNVAHDAAYDVIRPHARSALRSILTLHDSLQRLVHRIETLKADGPDHRLDLVQAIIEEHIPLGSSAVEDWRDVARDDVDEVIQGWPPDWRSKGDGNAN